VVNNNVGCVQTHPATEISLTFLQGLYTLQEMLRSVLCLLLAVACQLFCHEGPAFSAPGGWAATYGGAKDDKAHCVQQTSDGGYIVAGCTTSFGAGDEDFLVLKLRVDGAVEWQKTYGGVEGEWAESIQQTVDGGYIVAGYTESFDARETNGWVLKLRPDGTVEWQKAYGGVKKDAIASIQQTVDGGYIVAGRTKSFGADQEDAWVLKLRPDGTVEWQKTYGGGNGDTVNCVRQTSDGGYVVAGYTGNFAPGDGATDLWVLKLRPDGAVEWQRAYGGSRWDAASCIQQTNDGGYVVAGGTRLFGTQLFDAWILKLRPDGAVEWQKTYGGAGHEVACSIKCASNGGYVVAGERFSREGGRGDAWVLKLRADGSVEWEKVYGGNSWDIANCIQQTLDGGYIVAGWTDSFAEDSNLLVLRLRPDGSVTPSCNLPRAVSSTVGDSHAVIYNANTVTRDSQVVPRDLSTLVQDTDASVNFLCPPTLVGE